MNLTSPSLVLCFLPRDRIIVASPGGINLWTVVTVIIVFAVSFTGLLLRNIVLFLGGLGAGIISGLLIGLFDFVIRHRRLSKMKRLSPERILEMNEKNFEIRYAEIVKVEVRAFETYSKGSLFFPTFQEHQYEINFETNEQRHTFIVDRGVMQECLSLLRKFAPETVDIENV